MSNLPQQIAKQYGISLANASDIVAEQFQHAVRTRWQCWLLAAVAIACLVAGVIGHHLHDTVMPMTAIGVIWGLVGLHLAVPAIHRQAAARALYLADSQRIFAVA